MFGFKKRALYTTFAGKNDLSKTTKKTVTFDPGQRNLGWFNFAVFSSSHDPSHLRKTLKFKFFYKIPILIVILQ